MRLAKIANIATFVVFFVFSVDVSWGLDWSIERVDSYGDVYANIDIECKDPNNVLLLYNRRLGGVDQYAVRDSAGWLNYYWVGEPASAALDLALDSNGLARMAKTARPGSTYILTYYQETSPDVWHTYNFATNISAGNAQVGVDLQGCAQVAYLDPSTSSLKCSKLSINQYGYIDYEQHETVTTASVFNTTQPLIQMVMDSEGRPNILWYESSTDRLRRAYKPTPSGTWQVNTIYTGEILMGFAAAFDPADNLHVAYTDWGTGGNPYQIRHGVYNGASWQDEQVDPFAHQVGALAFDSFGQPHIGYVKFATGKDEFKYATLVDGAWYNDTITELASSSQGYERIDLAVDSQNHLHMAFRGDADELRYARLDAAPRSIEELVVNVSVDAEATPVGGIGFIVSDGAWDINVQKIPAASIDRRAVLEFNVGQLDEKSNITSARLELEVSLFSQTSSSWPTPSVYAYAGDGSISPSDPGNNANLAGVSENITATGIHSIDLDADLLSGLVDGGDWLGLVLTGVTDMFSFKSLENPYGTRARLILEIMSNAVPHFLGDASGDGFVDADDAALLAANWLKQSGATWEEGDFNVDGKVNELDAALMAANWGNSYTLNNSTVPEPGFFIMLLNAVAILLALRHQKF